MYLNLYHWNLLLHCTVKSFIDLAKYLFTFEGVTSILSERLSQDPLEKFFGMQRQRGRTHENPNVQEFCKNTQALRVINGTVMDTIKGNCRGKKRNLSMIKAELEKENQPLKKRKKSRTRKVSSET